MQKIPREKRKRKFPYILYKQQIIIAAGVSKVLAYVQGKQLSNFYRILLDKKTGDGSMLKTDSGQTSFPVRYR